MRYIYGASGSFKIKRVRNETLNSPSTYTVTIEGDYNTLNVTTFPSSPDDSFPFSASYGLKGLSVESTSGQLGRATLVYSTSPSATSEQPENSKVEQTSKITVSIVRHPDFDTWDAAGQTIWKNAAGETYNGPQSVDSDEFINFTEASGKQHELEYEVGTTQVITTEYFSSEPSSPKGDVGTLEIPSGESGSDKWKVDGAVKGKQGNWWTVTKTYTYSAIGWNTDFYP